MKFLLRKMRTVRKINLRKNLFLKNSVNVYMIQSSLKSVLGLFEVAFKYKNNQEIEINHFCSSIQSK